MMDSPPFARPTRLLFGSPCLGCELSPETLSQMNEIPEIVEATKVNEPDLRRRRKSATSTLAERMRRLFVTHDTIEERDPPSIDESYWEPNKYTKLLLIRTWSNDLDFLYQLGSEIYDQIFSDIPEAERLFPHVVGENRKKSTIFNRQVLRFAQVLSEAVRNLHNLGEFRKTTLYNIGRAHCKYADRGFRPQHWEVFQRSIKKSMKTRVQKMNDLTNKQKKDVVKAWFYLAEQIVQGMNKGFRDGMKAGQRKFSF